MYEELIRVLRHCGNPNVSCKGCADEGDCMGAEGAWEIGAMSNMRAAAEAIEGLSMKLHGDEAAIAGMKREIERMVVAGRPSWIPVTERLPEQNTRVIGFMAWKGITAIEYQHGKWYSIDHLQSLPDEAVTHWMPLPEPPKEEAE